MSRRENAKPTLLRRALACLVSAAMVVAFTPVVAWGGTGSPTVELDINQGSIEITSTGYKAAGNSGETPYTGSYTIKSTASGAVQNAITVSSGTHDIMLSNVSIDGGRAFEIASGATVNLTLTGTNTLKSGFAMAGLQVPSGSSLTIDGNGSLTATGGEGGAGIGGGLDGSGGSVTIRGGTVCAYGGNFGAGIGGGNCGFGKSITITGGTVCAYGGDGAAGIGGGASIGGNNGDITVSGGTVTVTASGNSPKGIDGTLGTGTSGNAVVYASSISGNSETAGWSGVIFEGATINKDESNVITVTGGTGQVYRSSVDPGTSFEVPSNSTLTIPANSALTLSGITAVNKGIVYVDGALSGTFAGTGPVYYLLTLNGATATGTTEHSSKNYGKENDQITLAHSDKTGYTFSGWDVSTSGTVTVGTDGKFTMPSAAVTITSKWASHITLDANDGSGSTSSVDVPEDSAYGTTLPVPSREGYTFAGWFTDQTGGTKVEGTTKPTGNATLYAHWTPNTNTPYVVNHWQQNINGGDECNDTNFTLVDTANLSGTTNASVTPAVKSYIGFTAPSTQTVSIAADGKTVVNYYYTRDSYTVTLNSNEGTINSGNVSSYTYGVGATLPTDVTKTGYTFAGWYSDGVFSGDPVTTISTSDAGIKAYWAKWTVNQYTITFESNGGTAVGSITQNYGSALSLPASTKENYDFGGWYTDSELTTPFASVTMPAADTKLYAKWTAKQYNVTLDANGGTINSGNVTSYTYGVGATLPTDVTKSGYTFAGWYDSNNQKVTEIAADSTGDVALAAKWNYVPPTYNLPATVKGGIAVKATVSGSTAVVGEISASALESAAGSGAATVTIDLSGLPKGVTQVQLSKSTVGKLLAVVSDAGNAVESATVNLGGAVLTLDAKALAAVAEQVKGTSITLGVKETKADSLNSAQKKVLSSFEVVQLYFTAEIKSAGAEIHDFGGGAVRVSVAFEPKPGHNPARYVVLYVGEDGAIERYAAAWAAGMLSFMAPHFSTYAVVYVEDEALVAIDALEALPDAGKLKTSQAKKAVKKAEDALKQVAALDDGQKMLVDEALIANAESVVKRGNELVATADKKAVGKVKDKAFAVKAGSSKSIYFKTKASSAGTKVTYKKTKGSKYISVTKSGKVTAKKGMRAGKKYTAKVKVTCGKSWKYVKVTVKVRG